MTGTLRAMEGERAPRPEQVDALLEMFDLGLLSEPDLHAELSKLRDVTPDGDGEDARTDES